ncbi:hypothetical protein ACI6QG_11775 [Roseococcus sp. DSY-14]|uniref:hypothetical protein n=1 Tax=Roseococcus sp. DSY-14 TaxID=3369650 RepID=UPI00387B339A
MTLALQLLPLLLLLALLASGRVGPVAACGAALLAALPGIALTLPGPLPAFLLAETPRAAWLAAQPMAVVAGGLLFQAAVASPADATPREANAARAFACVPLGMFLESVTGFAVGAVFALVALRRMGISGPVAVALSLLALTLVPWGGLGPGTTLGAALAGVGAHDAAALAAWPNAFWVASLAPVGWGLLRAAGLRLTGGEAAVQAAALAVLGVLLVLAHRVLPFELAGIAAAGPVAAWALWRADPPPSMRAALAACWPYLLLTACLLAARAVPHPPAWAPFAGLPAFPLTHVAVVLWAVSLALLGARGRLPAARGALGRAGRPALTMLLYVVLGRWLAGSGVAAALAAALVAGKGAAAPFALVPMGFGAGFVTGSNVGANAALMPVQAALGQALGWGPLVAPALHNFAGAAGAGMAIAGTSMLCALDGAARPGQVWARAWPAMALAVVWGTAFMLWWR